MSRRGSADTPATAPTPWLVPDGDDTLVAVLVVPRASRTLIDGVHDDALRIRLAAPPVDGAANAALLTHLAKAVGLPTRAVSIASGHTSRRKRVRLTGIVPSVVLSKLGVSV